MSDPVLSSLLRINRMRMRMLRRTLARHQYVGCMHLIVLYIGRQPGASQEDVVAFFALDKASVARGARRLEEMGHLHREQDPDDRRQYRLFLTPEGEEMRAVIDAAHDRFQQKLSSGIAPQDWEQLATLLRRLEENCCQEEG